MKFRLLFRMRGNGRVGSSVVGLKSGTISVRKYCSSQCRCAGDQSSRRTKRMPSSRSAGISSSLSTRYCSLTSALRLLRDGAQHARRSSGCPAPRAPRFTARRCFRPETRISKNSSRFVDEMQRNFSRSSSGTRRIHRLLQDAQVERKLRQLAVDVVVGKFEIQRVHGDFVFECADVSGMFTALRPSIRRRARPGGGRPSHWVHCRHAREAARVRATQTLRPLPNPAERRTHRWSRRPLR